MEIIPFNKPTTIGSELKYITNVFNSDKTCSDGSYTKRCELFFENKYKFTKTILTTSCTSALEISALLIDIKPNDEIIIPSFTFVSTANAFAKQGAKIIFADSKKYSPNINVDNIEKLITKQTKAIIIVHYAGISVDMDKILALTKKYNLFLIEDAAQAIDSYYNKKPLGSFGHLSAFSFHETKNIQCGEGGLLVINDKKLIDKAEILSNNGTNKAAFTRGEVDKYEWISIGSSYKPAETIAAQLYAQLENIDIIQKKRISIWNSYYNKLKDIPQISLPKIPDYASNNGHMFYFTCDTEEVRNNLIKHLKNKNITATFHYQCLHKSPFYTLNNKYKELVNAENFEKTLIRLPLYFELSDDDIDFISNKIKYFFEK